MARPDLDGVPLAALPSGFTIRPLRGANEAGLWTEVQRDAEPFLPIIDGLFAQQFGSNDTQIATRCFFVANETRHAVGTISAWVGGADRPDWGRIHWVAVRPAFQRRGLARAALSFALDRLRALGHTRAYLHTSTNRLGALKLYLDAGFVPDRDAPGADDAWRGVAAVLPHPRL